MKKRFLMGRGLLATTLLAAGGALALWPVGAGAAGTPPQISVVASHSGSGTVSLGTPQPAASAKISPAYVAYDHSNGDAAVISGAHVYLIAGATEPNEYHIQTTTPPKYGTLVKGDVYVVAGNGLSGMIAAPGSPVTGGSTHPAAVTNPIAPISVAFDNSGNLLIGENHSSTARTVSGVQMVAKCTTSTASCTDTARYGYSGLTGGNLYSIAGVGAWTGVTNNPNAIIFGFQVQAYGLAVDSLGNIIDGAAGNVVYLNYGSKLKRYNVTLTSGAATTIAGTATGHSNTCSTGNLNLNATTGGPNLQWPEPSVTASGNVYLNDNRASSLHHGCAWVLPATTGKLDGQTMLAGKIYTLTGTATSTPLSANGAVANVTSFPNAVALRTDLAGNVLVALAGTHPALRVIAESTGHYYGQTMTKGDVYTIAGGPSASRTTTPGNATGFEFAGAARTASPPEFGLTSLTPSAAGDLLLTDGASATTGTLYEITGAPTGPPTPSVTSVTPTSGHIAGGLTVTVHGHNLTGITKVKFGGVTGTSVHFVNATEVTAKDPAHVAGKVAVSVTATLGTASKSTAFTYLAPTPTSVTVTISGTRYKGTKLHLGAHVTPPAALGKVTFDTTDPAIATCSTLPVANGSASCTDTLTTTGAHKIVAHFTPTTGTAYGSSTSAATPASSAFTVTTRPTNGGTVRQPIQMTVAAGRLTLSCTRYATVETPPTITSPPLGAAIKTCPIIILPKVQLNGVQQTRTSIMNPIYVFTARGTATAGWALSAAMVPTVHIATDRTLKATPTTAPHVAGTPAHESITVSTSCASKADFCDETGTLGATQKHGNIPATDLTLNKGYTCTPAATNHNPTPPAKTTGAFGTGYTTLHGTFTGRTLALCTAAAGTSGGKFEVSGGKFTLTVPSIIRHGTYFGTVEYSLVSIG